jgi:hypothetical protein
VVGKDAGTAVVQQLTPPVMVAATMQVDLLEPETKRELIMAEALEAFSGFVLEEETAACLHILEKHTGASVGELQGGSDEYEIYRASMTDGVDAVSELMQLFYAAWPRYAHVLTEDKLQRYMQTMLCDKRRKSCRLGNPMLIMAFGPTTGQVRHIDHTDPNLQICLYMSPRCPSTIVYAMEGPFITHTQELIDSWERDTTCNGPVPDLVKTIMLEQGDTALRDAHHSKYFSFWSSINAQLESFGKLYQAVTEEVAWKETNPGTILCLGGNQVHAGPPTVGPRMFAFATGIPIDPSNDKSNSDADDHDNDGEVQYCPVLLHVDLCCLLFGFMDFDYAGRVEEHGPAKRFLLERLPPWVREYPGETYVRLLDDDRSPIRDWLGQLVESMEEDSGAVQGLLQQAVESETVFYSPDVAKRRAKKKKKKGRTRTVASYS